MKEQLPKRKEIRVYKYNYSKEGLYFLTICVKERKNILSSIIYEKNINKARIELLEAGKIVEKHIESINKTYSNIKISDYVIMPNHVHMICEIIKSGSSRTPTPTNNIIPFVVSTFKRLTNKKIKNKIWQRNYYEHIIRDEKEYLKIYEYIENNPIKWQEDKYYNEM